MSIYTDPVLPSRFLNFFLFLFSTVSYLLPTGISCLFSLSSRNSYLQSASSNLSSYQTSFPPPTRFLSTLSEISITIPTSEVNRQQSCLNFAILEVLQVVHTLLNTSSSPRVSSDQLVLTFLSQFPFSTGPYFRRAGE